MARDGGTGLVARCTRGRALSLKRLRAINGEHIEDDHPEQSSYSVGKFKYCCFGMTFNIVSRNLNLVSMFCNLGRRVRSVV